MSKRINRWNVNGEYYDIEDHGRGIPGGVATLDQNGRIPFQQLPESSLEYKGLWDAETNYPTLEAGAGSLGDMYIVSQSGTQDLGEGDVKFYIGDRVLYSGSVWERLPAGGVTSVNGKSEDVVLTGQDITLNPGTNQTIDEAMRIYPPIGFVGGYAGSTDPTNWFICDGRELSKTAYAELYAVIGDNYSRLVLPSDSSKFRIPDLREGTIKGIGLNALGTRHLPSPGMALGDFMDDRMQSHTHRIYNKTWILQGSGNYRTMAAPGQGDPGTDTYWTTGDASGSVGVTTEVKAVGMNYIIRYK